MLFSSMTFIYIFLPIVLLLHWIAKPELRNLVLLIASIVFYAWNEPKYLPIMLSIIFINYFGALAIQNWQKHKKLILFFTIIMNLGFLIYFKYFNFLINNLNSLFNQSFNTLHIIMPIGISFYTFQALSYIIDVYKGECKAQKNWYKLALFICLFPQLVAGPILKYHDIETQIEHRKINFENTSLGVKRFIIGLSKKVLIANTLGVIVDKIFIQDPQDFSQAIAWLGSIAYTLQLYFDFSGYSDMAIGLGLIFGFKFMENFNYPYISKSITEFWRRWHISLSTWFKQYVYIPLGGNRIGKIKTLINLAIVFILTGIWHGAEWTFIIWGIWHGLFIIIEKIFKIKDFDSKEHNILINILRHIYCLFIIIIGWVLFRSENIHYALQYLANMFGLLEFDDLNFQYNWHHYINKMHILPFVFALFCCTPIFKNILYCNNKPLKIFINAWLLLLFYLSTITIASDTYNPFIYFRF